MHVCLIDMFTEWLPWLDGAATYILLLDDLGAVYYRAPWHQLVVHYESVY